MQPDPNRLDLSKNGPGSELFIGLVAPVGVNLRSIQSNLFTSLERLGYTSVEVKLSKWILDNCSGVDKTNDYTKLHTLMKIGSKCRSQSSRGDFFALAGIEQIKEYRLQKSGTYPDTKIAKVTPYTCYVFNQLKHPDEVKLLRWIYGNSFYLIGTFSPSSKRLTNLAERIETTSTLGLDQCTEYARNLIDLDYSEQGSDEFGQNIQKTFPQCDVFLNEKSSDLINQIDRFVELIFSHPFHTPTKDEQGMCLAKNASLRSADLARQIGAAITTTRGEVISIGCNEAARPGGGQYWSDDSDILDKRDFRLGVDSNDRAKAEILTDLLEKIKDENALVGDAAKLVADAIAGNNSLSKARLFDVIEYFRSVHAEMAALIDAARRGISVNNATMYATTFPCHECAKHIVAAGIPRLVYIEPYPKSKALELFDDAIVLNESSSDLRTAFESFVGIAPRKFSELFELGSIKRKDSTGAKSSWTVSKARLRRAELETTYFVKESYYSDLFKTACVLVLTQQEKS